MFNVTILTLYKEVFPGYLGFSNLKKALDCNLWKLNVIDIRDFALDKHKKVDDKVFGGGRGLLLKADVLSAAIEYAFSIGASKNLVYPSPRGVPYNQSRAYEMSAQDGITIICGHFEGIDERIIEKYQPKEISLGDYVLSGGELAAMVIVDSALRLLPNVINSQESFLEESFKDSLLEYPQYTHPRIWENMSVPEVLFSGNHKEIAKWRLLKSQEKTKEIRPDLWDVYLKAQDKKNVI
jgi:tRNA (guanine37-N1)-methyltransferase